MKIAVAMPDETYDAYKELAKQRETSMAALMRDALHAWLAFQSEETPA